MKISKFNAKLVTQGKAKLNNQTTAGEASASSRKKKKEIAVLCNTIHNLEQHLSTGKKS